jgi:hypothetical protein
MASRARRLCAAARATSLSTCRPIYGRCTGGMAAVTGCRSELPRASGWRDLGRLRHGPTDCGLALRTISRRIADSPSARRKSVLKLMLPLTRSSLDRVELGHLTAPRKALNEE